MISRGDYLLLNSILNQKSRILLVVKCRNLNLSKKLFTCVSVKLRLKAKLRRSHTDKYRVVLNLFSNDTNCSYVNAVLALKLQKKKKKTG